MKRRFWSLIAGLLFVGWVVFAVYYTLYLYCPYCRPQLTQQELRKFSILQLAQKVVDGYDLPKNWDKLLSLDEQRRLRLVLIEAAIDAAKKEQIVGFNLLNVIRYYSFLFEATAKEDWLALGVKEGKLLEKALPPNLRQFLHTKWLTILECVGITRWRKKHQDCYPDDEVLQRIKKMVKKKWESTD